jgi:hypothetical protein
MKVAMDPALFTLKVELPMRQSFEEMLKVNSRQASL